MTTVELRPHPAKFSDAILAVLQRVLEDEAERHQRHLRVLDPMRAEAAGRASRR